MVVYGESMDNSLIQELENEEDVMGVPVCVANLSCPVFEDTDALTGITDNIHNLHH